MMLVVVVPSRARRWSVVLSCPSVKALMVVLSVRRLGGLCRPRSVVRTGQEGGGGTRQRPVVGLRQRRQVRVMGARSWGSPHVELLPRSNRRRAGGVAALFSSPWPITRALATTLSYLTRVVVVVIVLRSWCRVRLGHARN
jgi:hypothetical protein